MLGEIRALREIHNVGRKPAVHGCFSPIKHSPRSPLVCWALVGHVGGVVVGQSSSLLGWWNSGWGRLKDVTGCGDERCYQPILLFFGEGSEDGFDAVIQVEVIGRKTSRFANGIDVWFDVVINGRD